MGSYDAELEYKEFAKINYRRMRGDIERAVEEAKETGDNRPILLVVGEMDDPVKLFPLRDCFNWLVSKEHEYPPKAAAYPFLAALRAAQDVVGREKMLLSIEVDPDWRGYCKNQAELPMEMDPAMFKCYLAGYLGNKSYRVSYDDQAYSPGFEGQERFDAQMADIKNVVKNTNPDIVVRYGSAKYFGALQGHPYEKILDIGGSLEKGHITNAFNKTFSQTLYYNAAYNGFVNFLHRIGDDKDPIKYFENSNNAVQLESPPGAFPDGHDMDDIWQNIEEGRNAYYQERKDNTVSLQQTDQITNAPAM